MSAILRHKEVLEEIKVSLAKKSELQAKLEAESKHLEALLAEEHELFHQIKRESLFNSMGADETI